MSSEIQYRHEYQQQQPKQKTFPFILYDLLEYATGTNAAGAVGGGGGGDRDTASASSSSSSSITWLPDGTAFIIQNKDVLMRDIMPKFFPQQTKFRSFVSDHVMQATATAS